MHKQKLSNTYTKHSPFLLKATGLNQKIRFLQSSADFLHVGAPKMLIIHLGNPNSTSGTAFDEVCVILRRNVRFGAGRIRAESVKRILGFWSLK